MLLLNKAEQQAIGQYFDFNTSHVTIKQIIEPLRLKLHLYFNTSHVTIKLFSCTAASVFIPISIHHMLLLNVIVEKRFLFICNFNTSHVTIKPKYNKHL